MADKTQIGIVEEHFLLELSGMIAKEWLDIGRYLGIPEAQLHQLGEDNRGNQKETVYQTLLSWKQREGRNATYRVLAEALQKANRKDLADLVKDKKETKPAPVQQPTSVAKPVKLTPKHGDLQSHVNQLGRHNLVIGSKRSSDVILFRQNIRKHGNFLTLLQNQTHDFIYNKKSTETITAVLVRDNWDDNTGGNAEVIQGGPGQNSVKVKVTSQLGRGMDFTCTVYGRK